jgi:uncharacterized protein YidB (DUF937 family)
MNSGDLTAAITKLIEDNGGLSGLLQRFDHAGLGQIAQSWISRGTNHPVTPAQLHDTLGGEGVQQAGMVGGMSPGDLCRQLAICLPEIIDHMTPDGKIPETPTTGWVSLARSYFKGA